MSSALCDSTRGALPPIPGLIPITALRSCTNGATTNSSNNNNNSPVTTTTTTAPKNLSVSDKTNNIIDSDNNNCVKNQQQAKHGFIISRDNNTSNKSSGDNINNYQNNNNNRNSTTTDSVREWGVVGSTRGAVVEQINGGGRLPRTRRSTTQLLHHRCTTIDSNTQSRDRDNIEQAPTRRSRPERHRKSDRRRCGHRTDRQKCATTNCSRSHSSSVRRKIQQHRTNHNTSIEKSTPDQQSPATTVPRVNPIFLWVKQEDTRIVEVRCEDYDKRNRIRLTKTAHGWRAIPRTETLAPTNLIPVSSDNKPESTADDNHQQQQQQQQQPEQQQPQSQPDVELESEELAKQQNRNKVHKSKKSSKSKRKIVERFCDDSQNEEVLEPEIEALTVTREETSSPAWSAPVNIESHLPSHTITIPRKKLLLDGQQPGADQAIVKVSIVEEPSVVPQTSCSHENSSVVIANNSVVVTGGTGGEGNECCVNSTDCSAPPLLASTPSPPSPLPPPLADPSTRLGGGSCCDVTPLDNLLAVAEFEFNHQVHSENEQHKQQQQLIEQHQENVNNNTTTTTATTTIIELDCDDDEDEDMNEDIVEDDTRTTTTENGEMMPTTTTTTTATITTHSIIDESTTIVVDDIGDDDINVRGELVEVEVDDDDEDEDDDDVVVETTLMEPEVEIHHHHHHEHMDDEETIEDDIKELTEQHKEFFENIVQLNKLLESRNEHVAHIINNSVNHVKMNLTSAERVKTSSAVTVVTTNERQQQGVECDYNDCEDENNLAMDDIITRLEQSLQSPETTNTTDVEQQICADADTFIRTTVNDCAESSSEKIEETETNNNKSNGEMVTQYNINNERRSENEKNQQIKPEENQCVEHEVEAGEVEEHEDDDEEDEDVEDDGEVSNSKVLTCPTITQENSVEILDSTTYDEKSTADSITDLVEDEDSDVISDVKITQNLDNDEPTDLSIPNKRKIMTDEPEFEDEEFSETLEDELPTDLSIRKRTISSPSLRVETPRPPSHSSETIQSPQPSGIPAVPPSPDIFFANSTSKNKSLFLETLLSSSSPKLCLTPEVTITRQQKEPLDLGKSRKSASPTVTCSEEVKNDSFKYNNNDGKPNTKRLKVEDITLKNLLHKSKETKSNSNRHCHSIDKPEQSSEKDASSRLLQLLTNELDPDPLVQFKQLISDGDQINIPDPLLVPKDKLNQILITPGIEIPRLLAERPELRLPDALAFPQLLQNPDILVISLAQLQIILQKHTETMRIQQDVATKPQNSEKSIKSVQSSNVPKTTLTEKAAPPTVTNSTDFHPFSGKSASTLHSTTSGYADTTPHKSLSTSKQKDHRIGTTNLAGDIDAATTAAFNQMLWLPYLNQLEAAAMACGNNTEFLKALNSVFPPAMPAPFDPNQMFPNFALHSANPNFPPTPMDYTNQLELAMWQEAMMKANMASQQQQVTASQQSQQSTQRNKTAPTDSYMMKSYYRDSSNNAMYNNSMESSRSAANVLKNSKQNVNQKVHHTSARTSPIAHNFQQRFGNSSGTIESTPGINVATTPAISNNPYMNMYPFTNPNLQIPHYNPTQQWNPTSTSSNNASNNNSKSQHSARVTHANTNSSASNNNNSNNNNNITSKSPSVPNYANYNNLLSTSKNDYLKYQQNILNAYQNQRKSEKQSASRNHNHTSAMLSATSNASMSSHHQQKPRVTCKSLQNLLSPSRLSQDLSTKKDHVSMKNNLPTSTGAPTSSHQPIDLSGAARQQHELSSKYHQHYSTTSSSSKLKVKQHLVDSMRAPKLLKQDEVPEVGSTTSSLEEMTSTQLQDVHNQLWHPLFGNQKSYTSPWRWTTVTVNGD